MPWKETCPMDQRYRFVVECEVSELRMSQLCCKYGISRKTGYKWLDRYRRDEVAGLANRSRAPRAHPNRVRPAIEQAVIDMRRRHPSWGPKKLRVVLLRRDPVVTWPACSTIGEILKRHNLSRPRRRRRRTPAYTDPFVMADRPNAVWCVDFKGWFRTGNGTRCDPLTLTDAYSRYLLCCRAVRSTGIESVQPLMERLFRQYGLPWAIRSDNGPPFASRGLRGLSRLSVWWLKLGIVPERIDAGHPEQNGRHERIHLTLKQETANPPAQTPTGQQRRFSHFIREYNHQRPHEALGMRTPSCVYQPSGRPYPKRSPQWEYPCGMTIRRVYNGGRIRWHSDGVFLSHVLTGESVGLSPVDDRYWQVWLGPLALCVLDSHNKRILTEPEHKKLASEGVAVCRSSFRCAPGTPTDAMNESVTHVPG